MQRLLYIDEAHMALDIFCFAVFFTPEFPKTFVAHRMLYDQRNKNAEQKSWKSREAPVLTQIIMFDYSHSTNLTEQKLLKEHVWLNEIW